MDVKNFIEPYRAILVRAGWRPGRKINASIWLAHPWVKDWPAPIAWQRELIEQLGLLTFAMQYQSGRYPFVVDLDLFPDYDDDALDELAQDSQKLGESLYPFGVFTVSAPYQLFATPSGRIVMAGDSPSYVFGRDMHESLTNLLLDGDKAMAI